MPPLHPLATTPGMPITADARQNLSIRIHTRVLWVGSSTNASMQDRSSAQPRMIPHRPCSPMQRTRSWAEHQRTEGSARMARGPREAPIPFGEATEPGNRKRCRREFSPNYGGGRGQKVKNLSTIARMRNRHMRPTWGNDLPGRRKDSALADTATWARSLGLCQRSG